MLLLGRRNQGTGGPENTAVTVGPAPPTSPYGCIIRCGATALQHPETPTRMAAAIHAMLRESTRPWTATTSP